MAERFFDLPGFSSFIENPTIQQILSEKNISILTSRQMLTYLCDIPEEFTNISPPSTKMTYDEQQEFDDKVERYRTLRANTIRDMVNAGIHMCIGEVNEHYTKEAIFYALESDSFADAVFIVKNTISPIAHSPGASPSVQYRASKIKAIVGFCIIKTIPFGSDWAAKIDLICSRMQGLSSLFIGLCLYILKQQPTAIQVASLELSNGFNNVSAYCAYRRMGFSLITNRLVNAFLSMIHMENDLTQYPTPDAIIDSIVQRPAGIDPFCDKSISEVIRRQIKSVMIMQFCLLHYAFQTPQTIRPLFILPQQLVNELRHQYHSVLFLLLEHNDPVTHKTAFEAVYHRLSPILQESIYNITTYRHFAEFFIKCLLDNVLHLTDFFTKDQLLSACDSIIQKLLAIRNPKDFYDMYLTYTGISMRTDLDHAILQDLFFAENRSEVSQRHSQTQGKLFKRNRKVSQKSSSREGSGSVPSSDQANSGQGSSASSLYSSIVSSSQGSAASSQGSVRVGKTKKNTRNLTKAQCIEAARASGPPVVDTTSCSRFGRTRKASPDKNAI